MKFPCSKPIFPAVSRWYANQSNRDTRQLPTATPLFKFYSFYSNSNTNNGICLIAKRRFFNLLASIIICSLITFSTVWNVSKRWPLCRFSIKRKPKRFDEVYIVRFPRYRPAISQYWSRLSSRWNETSEKDLLNLIYFNLAETGQR